MPAAETTQPDELMQAASRAPLPDLAARQLPRSGEHLLTLDGLRGMAVFLVLMHHFIHGYWHSNFLAGIIFRIASCGWTGVDLFFVLSGFLITGILFDAKESRSYFRTFYMRRILRIFPLYYGVLIVVFVFVPLLFTSAGPLDPRQIWYWLYASNLHYVFTGRALEVADHFKFGFGIFWSLAVEEHFYLLWPFLIWMLSRRAAIRACTIIICAALALRLILFYLGPKYGSICYTFTLCRIDTLAVGSCVALLARGPRGMSLLIPWARGVLALCTAILLPWFIINHFDYTTDAVMSIGLTVAAFFYASVLVFVVTARRDGYLARFFASSPMRFLGRYSYGIYIFHGLFMYYLDEKILSVQKLDTGNGHYFLNVLIHFAVVVALVVTIAWLSWHCWEKHFLKLKRFFKYQKPAVVLPPEN